MNKGDKLRAHLIHDRYGPYTKVVIFERYVEINPWQGFVCICKNADGSLDEYGEHQLELIK